MRQAWIRTEVLTLEFPGLCGRDNSRTAQLGQEAKSRTVQYRVLGLRRPRFSAALAAALFRLARDDRRKMQLGSQTFGISEIQSATARS